MNPYISILRPLNGIMSIIAVYVGALVAGALVVPSFNLLLGMLVVFLVSGAGMIINDIFDIEIDRVNKPERPLPSGRITKKKAWAYSILLFIIGNVIAYNIGMNALIVSVFASLLLIAYAAKLKKVLLVGHLGVSLLVAFTFIFGGVITGNVMPSLSLAILAFLANIGREVYKSIEDVLGDSKKDVKSLAVKYGVIRARKIASAFIIAAVAMSFFPYAAGIMNAVYLLFVLIADVVFIAAVAMPKKASKIIKIAMLIALAAFLIGAMS